MWTVQQSCFYTSYWISGFNSQYWGEVRYGGIRRSSASPRPPCDGTPSASVWPSPRQTPGPPCPYPSDRTPPDATMKRVEAPFAFSSHSDLERRAWNGNNGWENYRCKKLTIARWHDPWRLTSKPHSTNKKMHSITQQKWSSEPDSAEVSRTLYNDAVYAIVHWLL